VFLRQEVFGEAASLLRVTLIGDVVPFEDASGSVTSNLHNYRFSDACRRRFRTAVLRKS
jgi:hypothetical protein